MYAGASLFIIVHFLFMYIHLIQYCIMILSYISHATFYPQQFIVVAIGIISRVIVYYRKKVIQTRVIRRIQRQINA